MKASKIIVIAAAAAAIGAAIPTVALMTFGSEKELPAMPSGKYEPVAVVTTAALPKETTAAATTYTTAAASTTAAEATAYTTAALTAAAPVQTTAAAVTTVAVTAAPVTEAPRTAAAQVTEAPKTAAAQETAAPQTESKPAPAPEQKPAAQPVPAMDGSTVTYKGKQFSTDITELDLSGKKISEAELPELKEIAAKLPNLQKLILCDCGLSNETLANLQNELGIRVVWRVKLGTKWSLRTDAVAFSVLIMDYSHVRMTSADLEVLKYCPDLLALDLGHQAITDLSKIAEYLPNLRLLILADNQISDLSPLANLHHLHYLELFVNRVTDLSPLSGLKELVDVNISYNPISDISPILNAPMMQRVWLEHTNVSADGVNQLRATYPEAKIVNIGKGSVDQGWRWGNARYEQMMKMWYGNFYGSEFQKFDDLAVSTGLRG